MRSDLRKLPQNTDYETPTDIFRFPHIDNVWARQMEKEKPGFGRLIEDAWKIPEFNYLRDNNWRATEKVDGTNIRVYVTPAGDISFLGKTMAAQIPKPLCKALYDLFHDKVPAIKAQFFQEDPDTCEPPRGPIVLYGEGYGPGIQRGGWYRDTPGFILFDVRVGQWWLRWDAIEAIAKAIEVDLVPIVAIAPLPLLVSLVRGGFRSVVAKSAIAEQAEGIVARPTCDLVSRNGGRIIVKIKTRDFTEWTESP